MHYVSNLTLRGKKGAKLSLGRYPKVQKLKGTYFIMTVWYLLFWEYTACIVFFNSAPAGPLALHIFNVWLRELLT